MPCPDSLEDAGSSKYCQNLRRTQPPRGPGARGGGDPGGSLGEGVASCLTRSRALRGPRVLLSEPGMATPTASAPPVPPP